MSSCARGNSDNKQEICWFCRKGRHEDCMVEIPVDSVSEGPHDCSFETKMVSCKCSHK